MKQPDDVIRYWYGPPDAEPDARSDLWWGQVDDQAAVDREIEEKFGDLVEAGIAGELESWLDQPETSLAYVLTLDQFPRHIYRGTPRVYDGDEEALEASEIAWDRGYHTGFSVPKQIFLTMPMMHVEDPGLQRKSVERFEWIAEHAPESTRSMAERTLEHAREHCEIVERFGRFPHRNPLLGREMSDEEEQYLEETGNWFGQKPD